MQYNSVECKEIQNTKYNLDTEVFILFSTTFNQMLGEHLETCYVLLLPDPSLMTICFNHIIFDGHSAKEILTYSIEQSPS